MRRSASSPLRQHKHKLNFAALTTLMNTWLLSPLTSNHSPSYRVFAHTCTEMCNSAPHYSSFPARPTRTALLSGLLKTAYRFDANQTRQMLMPRTTPWQPHSSQVTDRRCGAGACYGRLCQQNCQGVGSLDWHVASQPHETTLWPNTKHKHFVLANGSAGRRRGKAGQLGRGGRAQTAGAQRAPHAASQAARPLGPPALRPNDYGSLAAWLLGRGLSPAAGGGAALRKRLWNSARTMSCTAGPGVLSEPQTVGTTRIEPQRVWDRAAQPHTHALTWLRPGC